jgi:amidophosphoribosyltransferase
VKDARENLGVLLADHIHDNYPNLEVDFVVPVPESSCIATRALATRLLDLGHKCEYNHLLTLNTNRKKERSFILPTQKEREQAVAEKFIISSDYDLTSRSILLVDDSIVRGTTLKHILHTIKTHCLNPGPIYVASVAPPIINRNIFGIDIPDTDLLIGHKRTSKQVAELLGAELVIYQELQEMLDMFKRISPHADKFEHSMFI